MRTLILPILFVLGSGLSVGCKEPTDSKTPDSVVKISAAQKKRATSPVVPEPKVKPKVAEVLPDGQLHPGTESQMELLVKAKTFYLGDQLDKAEPYFKALSESKPLSGPVVSGTIALGDIYLSSDRKKEALGLYQQLLKRDASLAEVHLVVARAYERMDKPKEALASYEQTLRLQPQMVFVYAYMAQLYVKVGDNEASAKAYLDYERKIHSYAKSLEAVQGVTPEQRVNIIDAFSFVDDERAQKALVSAMKLAPTPAVRARAARALGEVQAKDALGELERALAFEKDLEVRGAIKSAVQTLKNIKDASP